MHVCMQASMHVCMNKCMNVCINVCIYIHTHIHTYIHEYIRTYMNTYIHLRIHTRMNVCVNLRHRTKISHMSKETFYCIQDRYIYFRTSYKTTTILCPSVHDISYLLLIVVISAPINLFSNTYELFSSLQRESRSIKD